nr:cupin domain-containing protein [Kineococcus indalonis]
MRLNAPGAQGADAFPGGVGLSALRVYDWLAADGLRGGSPHLHTASAEGYVVLGGTGAVQTLSSAGWAEHPLAAGALLWFTPGTVHRLVNTSGDLRLLVVMQNAGLPEAGDAVLTFPADVLADPRAYADAARAGTAEQARRRRDLALAGYAHWRERVAAEGPGALADLHAAAARLVAPRAAGWRELWRQRPLAQAERTGGHLDALSAADPAHLAAARVLGADAVPGERFGVCGRLSVWDLDGFHEA